MVYIDRNKSI